MDGAGNIYVSGTTTSFNFPTLSAVQPVFGGTPSYGIAVSGVTSNAFVTEMTPDGSHLVYSTFLGGDNKDQGNALAVIHDGSAHDGDAYIIGTTNSTDFPTFDPYQVNTDSSSRVMFVAKISHAGPTPALAYSTCLGTGASGLGFASGIAVDGEGNAYLTGSAGYGFPVVDANQALPGGRYSNANAIVAKLTTQEIYTNAEPPFGDLGNPEDTGGVSTGVYLNDGEFHDQEVDLEIPGRGLNWQFARSYRTGVQFDSPLGRNWSLNYDRRLWLVTAANQADVNLTFPSARPGDVVRIDESGRADLYAYNSQTQSFTAPNGFFTHLMQMDATHYWERDAQGMVYTYLLPANSDRAFMATMADRDGDTMQFIHQQVFVNSGYVDSGSTTSTLIVPYLAFWNLNQWAGLTVMITSGPPQDVGRAFTISSSNSYQITIQGNWPVAPPQGSTFTIFAPNRGPLMQVIDTLGRPVSYQYNAYGYLTQVADFTGTLDQYGDFTGRTLRFQYCDYTQSTPLCNDDLTAVTSPAVTGTPTGNDFPFGKTVAYQYYAGTDDIGLHHKLKAVIAPNEFAASGRQGTPRLTVAYDPTTGHVQTQTVGNTDPSLSPPAGGSMTYTYLTQQQLPPDHNPAAVSETDVTNRNGNVTAYQFNNQGDIVRTRVFTNGIRQNQPTYFETNYAYNADYELTEKDLPEGNSVVNTYDNGTGTDRFQQGNLLATVENPGSRPHDQARIETDYTYEPIDNQVRTVTDPRGYQTVSTFDYQKGNNVAALALILRQTTDQVTQLLTRYNILMNVGDVNHDGTTNQVAGNVIAVQQPSVTLLPGSNQAAIAGSTRQQIVDLYTYNGYGQPTSHTDPEGNTTLDRYYPPSRPGRGPIDANGGGYLAQTIADACPDAMNPACPNVANATRDNSTNPLPAKIPHAYTYDQAGNLVADVDGRGIETDYAYNQLNQVVQVTQAAQVPGTSTAEPLQLFAYRYLRRNFYDYNNNLVLTQTEDRGNTSGVAGDPLPQDLSPALVNATDSTPGNNSPTTLNTTGQNYYANVLIGKTVAITSDPNGGGAATGQVRTIVGNTSSALTLATAWNANAIPQAGATFAILNIAAPFFVYATGQATAATGTTLSDATQNWGDNNVFGTGSYYVEITGGHGAGQVRRIASNTATQLTVAPAWDPYPLPDATSTYAILSDANEGTTAFVDSVSKYDILDDLTETDQEVASGGPTPTFLRTRYRYDPDQNRVLTIDPAGNADGAVYDERDLLFQSIQGVDSSTRPSAGLYGSNDPTTFDRPGNGPGLNVTNPSTWYTNYDRNGNVVETVSPVHHPGGAQSQFLPGSGDTTATAYDGFDRPKTVTDALGNQTLNTYDPAGNVVRVIQTGDPLNNTSSQTNAGKTLAVTESVYDELNRPIATHQVLFQTPYPNGGGPSRTPALSVNPALASFAPYLADASTNAAPVPNRADITVLGRVSSLTEYDRDSRPTFTVAANLGTRRTDYDGLGRAVTTTDSAQGNGYRPAATGTATAGDATTLTASATWTPNQWQGLVVQITGGTGQGQFRKITGNTANVLTVTPAWATPPANGSTFAILRFTATPAGNAVQTAYDADGNPVETKQTDVTAIPNVAAENFVATTFYDALNRPQIQVDNLGQATDTAYDARGNVVAQADANGPMNRQLPRRGLGGTGLVDVNGFGNLTLTSYDGLSRPVETDTLLTPSGKGDGSFLGVDANGIKQAIPNGYLATTQAGDGIISSYSAYDADSQLLASRDDNGNATAYIYDNENRTLVQRQGLYLPGTSFAIAGGDSGTFPQTVHGIATDQTNANGSDTTTAYDLDGNVRTVTNPGDKTGIRSVLTYTVDALGRATNLAITNPGGSTFVGTPRQTWQYDGLSRTTQAVNYGGSDAGNQHPLPNVTTSRFYDALSRPIEEQQQIGTPPAPPDVVSWGYDLAASGSADNPSMLVYPDTRQVDSQYDVLDRLATRYDDGFSTNPIGTEQYIGPDREAVRSYQLNGNGGVRLTYVGQQAGHNADVGYDGGQRVLQQAWERYTATTPLGGGGTPVIGFSYQFVGGAPAYDRNNNVLVAKKLHDPGNAEVYHYRSDDELTSFQRGTLDTMRGDTIQTATATPGLVQSQDWLAARGDNQAGLDGAGNWTNTGYTVGGQPFTDRRSVTEVNATHTVSGTPYGGGAPGTYVVDRDGNLLDDGQRLDYYDALNRLIEVVRKSDGMEIARYAYDADGRRVQSVVTNGGLDGQAPNAVTTFDYDGLDVIQQQDDGGTALQFVYGDTGLWTLDNRTGGVTVAQLNDGQNNDQRLYYLTDPAGSVYGLVNKGNVLREAYQYDPYGRQMVYAASPGGAVDFTNPQSYQLLVGGFSRVSNPYLYAGYRLDRETNIYQAGARYYDAAQGRWTSQDPIGDAGGDGNWYRYVHNDPTAATDPEGTASKIVAHTLASGRIKLFQEVDDTVGWGWGLLPGIGLIRKLVETDRAGLNSTYLGYIEPEFGLNVVWRDDTKGFVYLADLKAAVEGREIQDAAKWFAAKVAENNSDQATVATAKFRLMQNPNTRRLADEIPNYADIMGRTRAEAQSGVAAAEGDYLYGPLVPVVVAGVTLGVRLKNAFDIVPKKYRGAVQRAFKGIPTPETLEEDLIVYRRWGGKSAETGSPWYSTKNYERAGNAQRYLDFPEGNTAKNLTVFKIPKGTTILRGKAASMVGEPGFGAKAVGGGEQIYLPDPSKAIKLEQLP